MQVVLVMFRGESERRSFSIARDITVIGRREDCDFRIPLGEISRKHCRLVKDGDSLRVEDMGSSNGTYHNGERVQEALLQPGDTLQVGSVAFVLQIDGVPADDELQPVTAGDRQTVAPGSDTGEITVQAPRESDADSNGDGLHDQERNSGSSRAGSGEFDPMSVLESGASGALPAMDDSSSPGGSMMIDLAENSQAGSAPADHP